ncbi:MAG: SDR family NAD(P)-dependent oxidoreductase [Lachnospiraceae bacterium]|nr:SDR family NAD(P)-dependent oxidoreductase [Lachnospiraceae bacterium]
MKRKTAVITGASRGIGAACAKVLASHGYDLILNCISNEKMLNELSDDLKNRYGVQILIVCGDVSDYSFVERMFEEISAFTDTIDVLINNAGIAHLGLLSDMSIEEWNRLISTNLTSVFSCSKFAIPIMLKAGSGKIINISSIWGLYGASYEVAYSATKGGIDSFTRALAKELAPSDIQVNAIACGVIDTDMNRSIDEESLELLREEIPAGRFASADEVAEMVFSVITSPSYLTGQIIQFDGGYI